MNFAMKVIQAAIIIFGTLPILVTAFKAGDIVVVKPKDFEVGMIQAYEACSCTDAFADTSSI
jgi:hypothetical protein